MNLKLKKKWKYLSCHTWSEMYEPEWMMHTSKWPDIGKGWAYIEYEFDTSKLDKSKQYKRVGDNWDAMQ